MDYVPGQPLDAYVATAQTSIDESLRLFAKICDAVNAAHLRGVIHRDLKPSNIRIDNAGKPQILDFGLAKVATSDADAAAMTMTRQFIGLLPWASPEQAEGAPSKIDLRTDVYSLGVILYQILTGKFPYDVVGNMRDVIDKILTAEPMKPRTLRRHINDEVETIVLKCLSKERERRYQTAGELARDVNRYLDGEPIEAKRDSVDYVLRKQLRRYRVPVVTAGAFILLIAVGFATSLTFWRQAALAREAEAKAAEEARTQADIAEAVNEFLNADLLAAVAPSAEEGRGREVTMREVLDAASERIEGRFEGQPRIEVAIRATLGETYRLLGEYAAAEPHLERALELHRRVLGHGHPDTLVSVNDLANLYADQGRFEQAESLYTETLAIQTRVLGVEDRDTLVTMNDLAILYSMQNRYDEAERLYTDTLTIQKRVLGVEHPDTLYSMLNLADLYMKQGRYDEAEPLCRDVFAISKRVFGDEHPSTLDVMDCLADLYRLQGRHDEAEQLYSETLEIARRVLGEDDLSTLNSTCDLARVYEQQGRYEEAESKHRGALEGFRRVFGDEHWQVAACRSNLAKCLTGQGRYAEAEAELLSAQRILAATLGDTHSRSHTTVRRLIGLYEAWEAAEPSSGYSEKAGEWKAKLPPDELATYLVDRGWELLEEDRHAEAEPLLRECLEIRQEVLPAGDWRIYSTMTLLAEALAGQGKFDEAEPLLLNSHEQLEGNPDASPERVREALDRIVKLYEAWEAADPGRGYADKAAEWRAKLPTTQSAQPSPNP